MSNTLMVLLLLTQASANPVVKADLEATPLEQFKKESEDYSIRLDDRGRSRLTVDSKPLLHWSNPARTAEDGAVFVWLKDGRPEVIGTIFTYKLDTVKRKHEFHSLSSSSLTAEFKGKLAWKPNQAGVKFQSVPKVAAPADNARQRLIQMKAIARDFSATMKNLEGETTELRLLPQPLYRYEPTGGDVLDGGLFSFAVGTDPEVLLLIEARRETKEWIWQYAFARFNYAELTASFKGDAVWHVDADPAQTMHVIGDRALVDKVYSSFHVN